jgi:DNA-binding NarL/FixJ family response regulator
LLAEIEALARSTRISLATVDRSSVPETVAPLDLTPRDREILAHIVAGRPYGEIAVSVHVSHMLHKTGTTNR